MVTGKTEFGENNALSRALTFSKSPSCSLWVVGTGLRCYRDALLVTCDVTLDRRSCYRVVSWCKGQRDGIEEPVG